MDQNSRRQFLGGAAAIVASAARAFSAIGQTANESGVGFPLTDYHVHLNSATLEQVAASAQASGGVKYGIV
jgi:hypothetical protein